MKSRSVFIERIKVVYVRSRELYLLKTGNRVYFSFENVSSILFEEIEKDFPTMFERNKHGENELIELKEHCSKGYINQQSEDDGNATYFCEIEILSKTKLTKYLKQYKDIAFCEEMLYTIDNLAK